MRKGNIYLILLLGICCGFGTLLFIHYDTQREELVSLTASFSHSNHFN